MTQPFSDELPQVVFFDAMGTLFDLQNSVGEIYQQHARKYDVEADANLLTNAFVNSFKSAPPLAFSGQLTTIKQQEFEWWKNVVHNTFSQINLCEKFSNFTDFFQEVYEYFASNEAWYLFPDVMPALENLRSQNIEMGVISNFDTRLIKVLKLLDLEQFFASITISSQAGFAKPDQNIFKQALTKHDTIAKQAWHIGDSIAEDYQGAKAAGIKALWLNRQRLSENIENQLPNLSSLG